MEKQLIRSCATVLQYPFLCTPPKLRSFHQPRIGVACATETTPGRAAPGARKHQGSLLSFPKNCSGVKGLADEQRSSDDHLLGRSTATVERDEKMRFVNLGALRLRPRQRQKLRATSSSTPRVPDNASRQPAESRRPRPAKVPPRHTALASCDPTTNVDGTRDSTRSRILESVSDGSGSI